jgi:hypothetical protein
MKGLGALLLLGLALALALVGCGGGGGTTLEVVSDSAPVETVDLGPNGKSSGDTYVFDGALFDADEGHRIGHAYGMQTSISVERDREVVQATITYTFDEGGSITIGGIGEYPLGDTGLIRTKPYERPILGGTGKYAGASGTVTTVRRADGRYEQTFHLED